MKTTCKKSWPVNVASENILWILYTPKIFPNLNVVPHLVVPAGWGSCLSRLVIFFIRIFLS